MTQPSLFDDDHLDIGKLFDGLDDLPASELEHRWGAVLADLIAIFKAELTRQQLPIDVDKVVPKLIGVMSTYLGGKAIYLPRGEKIKEALRDHQLYSEFNGRNLAELAKRYALSEPHLYAILRKQRQLARKRYQHEFPGF